MVEIDAHDLGLPHLQPAQQLAQGHDRVGGMDAGGGDLGQERLEDEIVVGVDELDLELAARRRSSALARTRRQAAADHQDLLLLHGLPSLYCEPHTYANAALRQVTPRWRRDLNQHVMILGSPRRSDFLVAPAPGVA